MDEAAWVSAVIAIMLVGLGLYVVAIYHIVKYVREKEYLGVIFMSPMLLIMIPFTFYATATFPGWYPAEL